jgi:hypothetical protein
LLALHSSGQVISTFNLASHCLTNDWPAWGETLEHIFMRWMGSGWSASHEGLMAPICCNLVSTHVLLQFTAAEGKIQW